MSKKQRTEPKRAASNAAKPAAKKDTKTEKQPSGPPDASSASEAAERVEVLSTQLRVRLMEAILNLVLIGKDLIELKTILDHGSFMKHIKAHFDMSYPTANRFMLVAEKLENHQDEIINLSQRTIYLLASASADTKREELIKQLKKNPLLSYKEIKKQLPKIVRPPRKYTIQSARKHFDNYYSSTIDGITGFTGNLEKEQQDHLIHLQAQLKSLEVAIEKLLLPVVSVDTQDDSTSSNSGK